MNTESRIDLQFLYALASKGNLALFRWCMDMKLIPSNYMCPDCGKSMKFQSRKRVLDGYAWSCKGFKPDGKLHHTMRSLRKGSYFNRSHHTALNILLMSYLWLKGTSNAYILDELSVSLHAVLEELNFFRHICVELCVIESTVLSGEVEILEKKLSRRKNFKGKITKVEWMIIGVEKDSSKFFLRTTESNSKPVLLQIIKEWVLPGSVVISDSFESTFLSDGHIREMKEDYNIVFQRPNSKCDIQVLQDLFQKVRSLIKGTYSEDIFNGYLAEYLWRRVHSRDVRSLIACFFKGISEIFPPRTSDSDK